LWSNSLKHPVPEKHCRKLHVGAVAQKLPQQRNKRAIVTLLGHPAVIFHRNFSKRTYKTCGCFMAEEKKCGILCGKRCIKKFEVNPQKNEIMRNKGENV